MVIYKRWRKQGFECLPISRITLTNKIWNTTGLHLYMGMWRRSSLRTSRNQRGSTLPCPTTLMQTCITTWLLEDPLLLSSTSSIKPQWTGTRRNKTATFGSEFVTARTTIDQIVDLQMTLHYLGIPIWEKSYVFGDNKTVIDASSTPHAKLHKRHSALSFHRVREAVTPSMLRSSICRVNTTLPTFSASTGLMLWYGEPWMPFYLLKEIHGIF
jgi:hypothetical protein